MSEEEEVKLDPADEVMSITLYKKDPFCLEYAFIVAGKDSGDDPKHLEQLNILNELLQKYIIQAERAVLNNVIMSDRRLRRAQKEQMDKLVVEGAPN